jgi:hypothetical protein
MPERERGRIAAHIQCVVATTGVSIGAAGAPMVAALSMRYRVIADALLADRFMDMLPVNRRAGFRQTVERLRERGVRITVPNESSAFLFATYESLCDLHPGERGWQAFGRLMVDARRWRQKGYIGPFDLREALNQAIADEYRAGGMITIQQVRDQLGSLPNSPAWLAEMFVENHHTVPVNEVLGHMLRKKYEFQSQGWVDWRLDQIKDTMPSLPMDVDAHRIGPSSFHEMLKARIEGNPPQSIAEWRQALSRTYDEYSESFPPESRAMINSVKEKAMEWLDDVGIDE